MPGGETAAVAPAVGADAGRASVTAAWVDARAGDSTPVADGLTGGAGRSAAWGTGDTGRADGRVGGATILAGGSAVGNVTGPVLAVGTVVVTGEREPRTKTSVMTSAALVPRTPIESQSHQRHLAAKKAGRRTAAGAPMARAFSLSARLSAS